MERAERPMLKREKQRAGEEVSGDKEGDSKGGAREDEQKNLDTKQKQGSSLGVPSRCDGVREKTGKGRMQKKKHHRDQPDGKGRE